MDDCFQDQYAGFYDLIYKNKDYQKECGYLEKIFKKYAAGRVRTVLDLACGTAGHIIPLAKRGYQVYGNDASRAMIKIAEKKTRAQHLKIKFYQFKMQDLKINRQVDAVIGMFSCIDYITRLDELERAFRNIRACLNQDGVFTFDFWNKDCVQKHFSPLKKKTVVSGNIKVTRISRTALDRKNSIANVRFTAACFESGKKVAQIKELHRMKYYRINDMINILEECGFRVLGCFPFMKLGRKASASDWNISIVATPASG